ncbi:unnamed protein product, partial [Vitis vinifera]|uniref:Uncharacterized protein n=1 Tax=Vitis vinifera TaxID=29760 RepID=D7TNC0_VITVI
MQRLRQRGVNKCPMQHPPRVHESFSSSRKRKKLL